MRERLIQLRWLGTACFQIRLKSGESLIIDPYLDDSLTSPVRSDAIERADLICISHGHFDHILDVGRLAKRLGSTVLCSHRVARNIRERFDVPPGQIRAVTTGETLKEGPFRIEVVPAAHIDNRRYFAEQLGVEPSGEVSTEEMVRRVFQGFKDPAVRDRFLSYLGKFPAGEQLNFIFEFPGNLKLHFFGSTPEPELLPVAAGAHAQVLVLQVLKGMEEVAFEVARRSGAKVVIPSHHDAFFPEKKTPDLEKLRSLFEKEGGMSFLEPEPGRWYGVDLCVEGG